MQKQSNFAAQPALHQLNPDFPLYQKFFTNEYYGKERMHYHNLIEIGLCLEGHGIFFINENTYAFQQGDMVYIHPSDPHIAQSPQNYPSKWWFLSFDTDFFQTMPSSVPSLLFSDKQCKSLLKLAMEELRLQKENFQEAFCMLMRLFFLQLNRLHTETPVHPSEQEIGLITPALNYIAQKYSEDIQIPQLAETCHLSPGYFRKIFKQITGKTPLEYLNETRLTVAQSLLQTSELPISEIAMQVGYNTLSSFNRQFKEAYHLSPRQYRTSEK